MDTNSFKKILQQEAENLFNQTSTPMNFMNRIQPLIKALEEESASNRMSENDLESILVEANSKKKQHRIKTNNFFDVVDLCMYRAN